MSNGEIEVWNSIIIDENEKKEESGKKDEIINADGYKITVPTDSFATLFKGGLKGIVYKKA